MPTENRERARLVYVGFRFDARRNDKSHMYRELTGQTLGRELAFKKELLKTSPGNIIEVDVKRDGDSLSVYGDGRSYTGESWTHPEVDVWVVNDRANTAAANASGKSRVDLFESNLKPLRDAYLNLPGPQRAALLAQVVAYITR